MKKHAIMVLDTETCNITPCDAVTRGNNLTYDIGYAVVYPSTGEVIYSSSNVVSEIFFGEREKMQSAYYANKLPQYYDDLANNRRTARSFFEIMNEIAKLCREYNIIAICAHNAAFDMRVLSKCLMHYEIDTPRTAKYLCTVTMGRKCFPSLPNHKLDTLCRCRGIALDHHRADSDSLACAALLLDYMAQGMRPEPFIRTYDLWNGNTMRTYQGKR